jgi:hypothetical protein
MSKRLELSALVIEFHEIRKARKTASKKPILFSEEPNNIPACSSPSTQNFKVMNSDPDSDCHLDIDSWQSSC